MPTAQRQFNALANQLSEQSSNVALSNAYDAAGNLQNHPYIGQMTYDGENRLLTFTSGGTTAAYDYDGEGQRVRKIVTGTNAGTTVYVNDAGGQLTAEIAQAGDDPDTGTRYLTADHLGSTRAVTDGSGNLVDRLDYFPFGQTIPGGQSYGNRNLLAGYGSASGVTLEFTGKERDAESGLDYFGARYFSGAQGRWTSPDRPFADQDITNPQSWNLYTYVRNNPLANIDRSGSQTQGVGLAAWLAEHEPQIIATANAIKTAKGFADIATAIKEAVWGSTTPSGKIEDALASDNVGVAMEGIVAEYVDLKFHGDIVGVNVPVPDPANPRDLLTDLDIQLKFAVVEIKTGTKRLGKNLDVKKQFGPVIVYAPQATPGQQRDLARNGGIWVGNIFDLLEKLTEVKENVQSTIKFPKNPDDQDQ
jgi:RHS repeat-associated protein